MAIAVIGGLISSTALSLVLVPVIYTWSWTAWRQWVTAEVPPLRHPQARPGDDAPIREGEETLVTQGA